MENGRSISTPLCATVEKEGNRSDRLEVVMNSLLLLHGLCKDNTSQDNFRSVNLYKEFPDRFRN